MRNVKSYLLSLILTFGAFTLEARADLNVVATTSDFGAIAKEIGGDKIELAVLGRPTEDPHFVDAKPSFIVKLNRADVLIEGGADLEIGWLPALLEQARNDKIASGAPGHVACSQVVSLLEVPSALDRAKGDVHAAGNPHYMIDPANAKKVASMISQSFCAVDASSCEAYKANLISFAGKLDVKIAEWQKALAPFHGAHIVAYHNSWPYFAQRFGLVIDLFLEPKPGIPPTPAHLADVIGKMKSDKDLVIIVEPYQNRKTAETVAEATGAVVVDVAHFPGALKSADEGYIGHVDFIVKSLAKALAMQH